MTLFDVTDLNKIWIVKSKWEKKCWAMDDGHGFGLEFMRKSKLKKN